jgi:hypothetical protein
MTNPDALPLVLPEHRDNPFIAALPPLMSEQEAIASLLEEPHFDKLERTYPDHLRRACIMRLNRHYFKPLGRHLTLESRLAHLLRGGYDGRNIRAGSYLKHLHNNHERVIQRSLEACSNPAPSTATAMSLIGCSGIGKTETISRILRRYPQVIEHHEPYSFQQVVWLKLECPHMGSARQLCLDFFESMDRLLGTSYFRQFHRGNLDLLSTQMGRIATQHGLGLLVIDELQSLISGRNQDREKLLNFLLALINKIGVPMLLVGTLAATPLLNDTVRNARRASGFGSLIWERLDRKDGWDYFISDLWRFQWTRQPTELQTEIVDCLYEETQGILDLAMKLFILAQFFAIQLAAQKPQTHGSEQLSVKLFRHVAKENFKLLEPMLTALKRGDREAIARYDDIRPFHDHIRDIFFKAQPSGSGDDALAVRLEKPVASVDPTDARQQVRQALAGFGVAPDVIELVLTNALAQTGSNDPIALIAAAVAQMQTFQPVSVQAVLSKPIVPMRKVKPALQEHDVRTIVIRGQSTGKIAHQALSEAGLISPVERLYRVS